MMTLREKIEKKDILLVFVLFFKVLIFYKLTDMTGMRLLTGIVTFVFLLLLIKVFSFYENKGSAISFTLIYVLLTTLMFADSMYFSYFNQMPSIKQLAQVNSMIVVDKDTFMITLPPLNVLLLADLPFTLWYFFQMRKRDHRPDTMKIRKIVSRVFAVLGCIVVFAVINPLNADSLRIVNKSEVITYHLRDIYETVTKSQNVHIVNKETYETFMEENQKEQNIGSEFLSLKSIGEGMDLIVIQMESMQNFVINRYFGDIELTPNLNRLIEEQSIYFSNYYQTIGRGNTSDAEFSSNNSLYPVIEGEAYRLYEKNRYHGLPWLLKEKGYSSVVYHGFEGDFWNREAAYVNQGFDDYISLEDLELTEKVAFGLSDFALFDQAIPLMQKEKEKNQGKPIHSFMITLSCHYPYIMPQEYQISVEEDSIYSDTLFLNYLAGVRYADAAIGHLIEELKRQGLYDHTVIALYGDHHGLNCKDEENYEVMSQFLGKEYDYDEMLKVPMILHIPNLYEKGLSQAKIDKVGGQVDFLPTLSYIMGLEVGEKNYGSNLFSEEEGFVASVTYMLKGSFIHDNFMYEASPTGVFEEGRAKDLSTGKTIEDFEFLREEFIRASKLIEASKYQLDTGSEN
ncbi:MAG: LTA synthase family protein [Vallitaleaceae bacterium]|nr:LTA synthase family protein [Vallitaleaceae bacterium]